MRRVGLVIVFVARTAAADRNSDAEALFREGRDRLAAGDIAHACDAFEGSQRLDPTLGTLLNLADCREKNGQLATAWSLFLDAERQASTATESDAPQLHDVAAAHAAALAPRVPKLTIGVKHPIAGLVIMRGTVTIEESTWNLALPVDGGTYTVSASAPGRIAWTGTVTVGNASDARAIDVPELALVPVVVPPPPPPPSRRPYYAAGASVTLFGAALVFDLVGNSTYGRSKSEVDDAEQASLYATANHERYAAEAFAIAGLVAGGVAVYLYVHPSAHLTATAHGVAWRW